MNFVYGIRPIEELLTKRGREIRELLIARHSGKKHLPKKVSLSDFSEQEKYDVRLQKILDTAKRYQIQVHQASGDELTELCKSGSHQGVLAVVGEFAYLSLEELLAQSALPPLIMVADGITDPQNLGAMFRSALLFGATGVVLPKDRCASVTPTVVRVSSGATEHLPCAQVTNLVRSLNEMKDSGIWIVGTVEKGGVAPSDLDLKGPIAFVMGNEQKGIRPLVQKNCDFLVTIPSRGPIASLNVAAATSVLFYEAARQRGALNIL